MTTPRFLHHPSARLTAALGIALTAAVLVLLTQVTGARQAGTPRPGLPIDALADTVWVEEFDISPDGQLVAYKSAKGGTYDIWIAPIAGGEARQLTSMPGREMLPKFSPDGRWIAFEADHGGTNISDLYIVAPEGGDPVRLTDHPLNDGGAMWAPDSRTLYFQTARYWDSAVAAVDIASGEITRVRAGGGGQMSLSPDGTTFVYTGNRKPDDDDQSNRDIYVAPVGDGEARLLTPDTLDALDGAPAWSPDGRTIAFISDRHGWNNLGVIDVATGETRMLLTEEIEHSEPQWSPDGRWISFTKNLDYHYHLFKIPAAGGDPVQLTTRGGVNGGSSATGQTRGMHRWMPDGRIAFYHSDPTMTGDVWVMSQTGTEARQVTNHQHASLRDPERFVWPELMEYRSFDGREVAGLVYKPAGSQAGDRLPALFFFRANSNGQHPVQWNPYIQYFVSRGYLVFAPNFRGSTGRGKAYRQAVHTFGGDHDVRDAFLGMDRLGAEGWVDPDRVGAFGGSTGGYFVTAAAIKDPHRFKAGVVWYGATDLVTLSTYAGMEGWNRFLIGKTPVENPAHYHARSIIYHAARVKVPLLFLYAQGDSAARFQQIEQYAVQAEIHGNWYDWVVYRDEPHGWYHWRPDSVRQSLEAMSRTFDRFVLGQPYDIATLMAGQREGIRFQRNPNIELWNGLVNGRAR